MARASGRRVLALVLLLGACGGDARRSDSTADSAVAPPSDTGIASARDSAGSLHADSVAADPAAPSDSVPTLLVAADSAIGDSLYHNSAGRCVACHGLRGAGLASLGPSLRDSVWLDTDGSVAGIASVIREGVAEPRGGSARMPAFGRQLDRAQIARIAVYVYSLSHPGALAPDSASARGSTGASGS